MSLEKFSNKNESLLARDDIAFLKEVVERYPDETRFLTGPAEASAEGRRDRLKDDALARQVFDDIEIYDEAIEADRSFMNILLFKDVLNRQSARFANLSEDNFNALCDLVHEQITSDQDLETALYILVSHDLGKTDRLIHEYESFFRTSAADHDALLFGLLHARPELFPGFGKLPKEGRQLYIQILGTNCNLGHVIQGEGPAATLEDIVTASPDAKKLRVLTELFDFAGSDGHRDHTRTLRLNDDTYFDYMAVMAAVESDDPETAYKNYMTLRGKRAGIIKDKIKTPEDLAKCRVVCMARIHNEEEGKQLADVWDGLSTRDKATLTREFNVSGLRGFGTPAILPYYGPALMTTAIHSSGRIINGAYFALRALSNIFTAVRENDIAENSGGIVTVNIGNLVDLAQRHPEHIIYRSEVHPKGPFVAFGVDA